ncbi:MAG: hypothetical protein Q8O64_05870 [Sideroxyarcus sp.]|nr:hypothetical protein [Sideroxyarcus sp.]
MKCNKTTIRKIGNSLGVIIPKWVLVEMGLSEGVELDVTKNGIDFSEVNVHQSLDKLRRNISVEILSRFKIFEIRERGILNLNRWKEQNVWGTPYIEWMDILQNGDDDKIIFMLLSMDDYPVQMRQSLPFTGMLPKDLVSEMKRRI